MLVTRPGWVSDELFPFDSHFVEVEVDGGGARVHYLDEGDGPVFVGLHGNPTWSFLYRHIVQGLAGRFRCVALDYTGFGLSIAPATGTRWPNMPGWWSGSSTSSARVTSR